MNKVVNIPCDRQCATTSCKRNISRGHVMCGEHWPMVECKTRYQIQELLKKDETNSRKYHELINDAIRQVADYQRAMPSWKRPTNRRQYAV